MRSTPSKAADSGSENSTLLHIRSLKCLLKLKGELKSCPTSKFRALLLSNNTDTTEKEHHVRQNLSSSLCIIPRRRWRWHQWQEHLRACAHLPLMLFRTGKFRKSAQKSRVKGITPFSCPVLTTFYLPIMLFRTGKFRKSAQKSRVKGITPFSCPVLTTFY